MFEEKIFCRAYSFCSKLVCQRFYSKGRQFQVGTVVLQYGALSKKKVAKVFLQEYTGSVGSKPLFAKRCSMADYCFAHNL